MIKAIAVDMDGTFLNDQKKYNEVYFKNIYQQMKKKGVHFIIASGNQYFHLTKFFPSIHQDLIYIAENGALIVSQNRYLFEETLDKELIKEILFFLESQKISFQITFSGKLGAYLFSTAEDSYKKKMNLFYQKINWINNFEDVTDPIYKLALNFPKEILAEVEKKLAQKFKEQITIVTSGHEAVDILPKNLGKDFGIRLLKEKLMIQSDEIAVFGDNMNDFNMFKEVKYSYAVKNARPELKKIAYETIGSNNEDAVLKQMEKLIQK